MEIMIILACSIVSSWFFTASIQSNNTFKEIFVWTWVLACMSFWIALFIYSIWKNYIASSSIWLMIWAMGPNTAKKYANKILNNIWKK
jgi:hypothetical protein